MASTMWSCPNYVGELFLIGANQTPFLNMMGGLNGGKQYGAFDFPTAQPWSLTSASQPAVTETASLTAPSATNIARTLATNTVQIFHEAVSVSYAKQSTTSVITANATTGKAMNGQNPVMDELDFQITGHLRQIALDAEYSFINGAYAQATAADVAAKTRGILAACSVNAIAAGGAALSKALFNALLREMAANGAVFVNMVLLCNAFQKQAITDLFGYAPADRRVGGVSVDTLITDFTQVGVVWTPQMPTDAIALVDMSVVSPVFCPVPGKGLIFYEALSKLGAAESGQLYGQVGLDHGPSAYHGKLTGLKNS
jgi:hypothetical protein